MFYLLTKYADLLDEATFQGKLFNIGEYPGVVHSQQSSDIVHGEVYVLKNPEIVLEKLDDYEECSDQYPEPTEFMRKKTNVKLKSGQNMNVWIYVYNRSTSGLEQVESGDYLNFLKNTHECSLSIAILNHLYRFG